MNDFLKGNIIRKDKSLPDTVIGRNIYMYVRFVDHVVGYLLAENNMSADNEYLCILPRDLYSVPTNTPVLARFIEKDGNRFVVEIKKEKEVIKNNCPSCGPLVSVYGFLSPENLRVFLVDLKKVLDEKKLSQIYTDYFDRVPVDKLKLGPVDKLELPESFAMNFICNECGAKYAISGDLRHAEVSWEISAYGSKHDI